MTPFVQHALLHRAIAHASDMALTALMESRPGMTKWKQGIGFLRSAYEDAKQYIAKAPPDQRQMKTVMNWFIILECIVKGPEMDEELADLQVCFSLSCVPEPER